MRLRHLIHPWRTRQIRQRIQDMMPTYTPTVGSINIVRVDTSAFCVRCLIIAIVIAAIIDAWLLATL